MARGNEYDGELTGFFGIRTGRVKASALRFLPLWERVGERTTAGRRRRRPLPKLESGLRSPRAHKGREHTTVAAALHADAHPQSRDTCARVVQIFGPRRALATLRRVQETPGARCTRSPCAKCRKHTGSHHRFTGTPGISCAMVLTAYSALLCLQILPECANGRF
jgi:hypothetical protein